jgi:L-cysteine S-thiosulfotransferase
VHKTLSIAAAVVAGLAAAAPLAGAQPSQRAPVDATMPPARQQVQQAIDSSWPTAAPEWKARLAQDATQELCTRYRNAPPTAVAAAILAREKASVQYPADGNLMGDWKHGEKLAQSGYGGRYSDYPARAENGGNCYACHQLDSKELSFGTLGPSLRNYGSNRHFSAAEVRTVYQQIYNPQSVLACAAMPRLGSSGFLTIDQIRDLVAYVMSPESPVNH